MTTTRSRSASWAMASASWRRLSWSTRLAIGSSAPSSGSDSASDEPGPPVLRPAAISSSSATTLVSWSWAYSSRSSPRPIFSSAASSRSVGVALEAGAEAFERALDVAGPAADRTGHPVLGAQVVEDRAADALHRVRLELQAALGFELLDRVDQAEDAGLDEVRDVDVRGQTGADAARDVLDQRRVVQHQPVAQALLPRLAVGVPERDDPGFHVVGGARLGRRVRRSAGGRGVAVDRLRSVDVVTVRPGRGARLRRGPDVRGGGRGHGCGPRTSPCDVRSGGGFGHGSPSAVRR
ncbi:nucleotide-binding universal stress UspA family protein [Saccharothrix longispora]|uniref:Nucleotide-binding universal stress UspA family protein n=1 Tax=Saccharothrix longispora TaxID=33920 RepID=A0ABU1PZS5_9PSEU|nr:nucleotide-binding universal stress UspA family protein [Saccharothrix longispora]